ncbi:MAG: branched-chain amino acid transport system ATP-binding protein [Parasphingorhabdus sp.]|jgi:branched-chain amino acid transport system ATP-binding protein
MLQVQNLTCGYGDVVAVDDLSFEVQPGEIHGLIGANGAGKTSTILAIAGLIPIVSGSIMLNGKDLTKVPTYQRVDHGLALVPEGRRVFSDLSVGENLIVGGARLSKEELEEQRQNVYEVFPRLAERRSQLAGSLSGGEQQMLAMGRGMMAKPKVLLVDELSLGLMPIAVDECYRVLRRLQENDIAILLVEQSTDRVLHVANQISVLESGRMAWSGSGSDAIGNNKILASYLGLADGENSAL